MVVAYVGVAGTASDVTGTSGVDPACMIHEQQCDMKPKQAAETVGAGLALLASFRDVTSKTGAISRCRSRSSAAGGAMRLWRRTDADRRVAVQTGEACVRRYC